MRIRRPPGAGRRDGAGRGEQPTDRPLSTHARGVGQKSDGGLAIPPPGPSIPAPAGARRNRRCMESSPPTAGARGSGGVRASGSPHSTHLERLARAHRRLTIFVRARRADAAARWRADGSGGDWGRPTPHRACNRPRITSAHAREIGLPAPLAVQIKPTHLTTSYPLRLMYSARAASPMSPATQVLQPAQRTTQRPNSRERTTLNPPSPAAPATTR